MGMMKRETIVNLKENPEILAVIRAVFPRYRKHKAIVYEARTYTDNGSYWDGGSRYSSFIVGPHGNVLPVGGPAAPRQFGGGDPVTVEIPRGSYVVVVGTFRGKPATATVYVGIA